MLNGKQILSARDKKTVEVHVPDWTVDGDDIVLVGTMGALDYADLQDWIDSISEAEIPDPSEPEIDDGEVVSCDSPEPAPKEQIEEQARKLTNHVTFELMVRWCLYSILDPKTHQPAFTIEQVRELGAKSFKALETVYREALKLNRITKEAAEALEKNSDRTGEDDSGGG